MSKNSLDKIYTTQNLLTYTHEQSYLSQRKEINVIKQYIDSLSYENKLLHITDKLTYIRSFGDKGVQGIVGLIKINSINKLVVFKISSDINRSIEHEYIIMESLNNLRKYCPHFSRSLGMINMPINSNFIFEPYNISMFSNDETLPRNILFMEYINKLPFPDLCKLCRKKNEKHIIISMILMIIIALQVSQIKKKFTHYDLHMSNILIQTCEPNSVFLYIIDDKKYCIPTYGFYPMIIDTGISYSDATENKTLKSTTDNYERGFQSTVFDHLCDVHHILLNTFYYIEVDNEVFNYLSNKIKIIFRHVPLLRKSGWKVLPNDLCDIVLDNIQIDCDNYKDFNIFYTYEKECLELLNNLITVPFKNTNNGETDYSKCFPCFMTEYHKMINIDDFTEHDILFILREIIDAINEYKLKENREDASSYNINLLKDNIYNRISPVLKKYINYDINYEKLLLSSIVLAENLETDYFNLLLKHKHIIKNSYDKTVVKNPLDMMSYIVKNITPHFNIKKDTIVYTWNADKEINQKFVCDKLTTNNIDKINKEYFVNKGEMLYNMLK